MLIVFLSLVLAGCARRSPSGVAQHYLESLEQFNYGECYQLLSDQDRTDRSLHEFLTEIPLAPAASPIWFRPILHVTRYEPAVAHRNPDGLTAYVPVRVTAPDLPRWERMLNAAAGPDGSPSELAQRSLDVGNYPVITYYDRIYLVKEHHHWHVAAGFAARDRVLDEHRQALVDYHEARFDDAIALYHSMIRELERQPGTGNLGVAVRFRNELAIIERAKAEIPTALDYDSRLKLSGVAMRMSEERVPAIFGAVTNTGNRSIDDLRLTVTWYSGRGKNLKVAHREQHPVVLTPIEFTDFSRQVIPFLPGHTRRFGFILSAPPEVERSADPYVTIASIAFSQIPAPLPKLESAAPNHQSSPSSRAGSKVHAPAAANNPANGSSAAAAPPAQHPARSSGH